MLFGSQACCCNEQAWQKAEMETARAWEKPSENLKSSVHLGMFWTWLTTGLDLSLWSDLFCFCDWNTLMYVLSLSHLFDERSDTIFAAGATWAFSVLISFCTVYIQNFVLLTTLSTTLFIVVITSILLEILGGAVFSLEDAWAFVP